MNFNTFKVTLFKKSVDCFTSDKFSPFNRDFNCENPWKR